MRLRCELPAITATTPGESASAASASSPPAVSSSGLWVKTSSARPPAAASRSRSQASCGGAQQPARAARAVDGVEHERAHARRRGRTRSRAWGGRRAAAARAGRRRGRSAARSGRRGRGGGDPGRPGRPATGPGAPSASSASTAAAVSTPARGRSPGSSPTTIRVPVANASIRGVGGVSPCTSRSWLPSAGYQGASRPGERKPLRGRREEPGMARGVEVGAVEERVGVVGRLDAVVAGRARVGVDRPAVEHGERLVELRLRGGVDEVARDARWRRVASRLTARTAAASTCGLSASCGRNVEVNGAAEPVEERHARRRLLVAHVGVGDLRERRERAAPGARRARAPCGRAAARPGRARARRPRRGRRRCASSVEPRARPAGPRRRTRRARAARRRAAARPQRLRGARSFLAQPLDDGLAHASGGRRAPSRRRPARAGRRRRAPTCPADGASGRSAIARREPRRRPGRTRTARAPRRAIAAGSATASAAPASTAATVGASPPQARRSATAPRRSRAVIASAWTSA